MELISPKLASIVMTGTSPVYISQLWTSGAVYQANTMVRREISGIVRDFRAKYSHTALSLNAPPNSWWWRDLGPALTSGGHTPTTNAALSLAPAWAAVNVSEGEAVYDPADSSDYRALVSLTSGENSLRPSVAALSSDEEVRARWLKVGASNAWAAINYTSGRYMEGTSVTGEILSTLTLSIQVENDTKIDRIAFAGLKNVVQIAAAIYVSGTLVTTVTGQPTLTAQSYGMPASSLVLSLTAQTAGLVRIDLSFTKGNLAGPLQVGVICVGEALYLGGTEWGVTTSVMSFSRKQRDEVFGTVSFQKRGFAKTITATCFVDPEIVSGDTVQRVLGEYDGQPIFWDFNNLGSNYDRLRMFGFFSDMSIAIPAETFESLSLNVESIVD